MRHETPKATDPQENARRHVAIRLDAARRLAPRWPRRRRIRALQELLLDANDLLLFCVDELEAIRSGARFSDKQRRPDNRTSGGRRHGLL